MLRPLLSVLALVMSLSATAAGQNNPDSVWAKLLERDTRVSFTSRTELAALTALDGGGLDHDGRAAAYFALGASGSGRGRDLLEETLASGSLLERCAAVLALGEMGVGVRELLESLREDPEPLLAECALLALMRTGRWAAAEYVEAIAESGEDANAQTAGELLIFATNAPASEATAASRLLLDLRWDAGKRFGLVDQRAWEVVLLEELASDEEFLKGFILNAAAGLDRPGVKDHFLSIVEAERKSEGAVTDTTIRAALRAMPQEVSLMVESGLWNPDWDILLLEIRTSDLEDSVTGLLKTALKIPAMRYRAVSLLVRSGDQEALVPVVEELNSGELGPMQLIWCCEALGYSGNQAAIPSLELLSRSQNKDIAAAAWIHLARFGDEQAAHEVEIILSDPASPGHHQVVRWMSEWADDPTLAGLLLDSVHSLVGMRAIDASTALSLQGSAKGTERLRELLRSGLPGGITGARAVLALSLTESVEDLAYIQHQFPHDGDKVVNEALALALFKARDPSVLPLIRAGIWDSKEFDQSVLASALLIEVAGMRALIDEVKYEPIIDKYSENARHRSSRYPMRVGYALGLWGGVQAMEDLYREVRDVRKSARHGAVLGVLASRTH